MFSSLYKRLTVLILTLTCGLNSYAQTLDDEEDLAFSFGDQDFISIATGSRQPLAKAPAVATVITEQDIKAIGATNLDEVLETVPGLHVSPSSLRFSPIYSIRGIYTDINPHVLMLVNGVPITQVFSGDRGNLSTIPSIAIISRIEVIRGPGSAIYGADAFAGVINIITKDSEEIKNAEYGIRAGSFNSKHAWVLSSNEWEGYNFIYSIDWDKTNGDDNRIVDIDQQTALDSGFLTNASLAPNSADTRSERIDTRIEIGKGKWKFNFWNWRQFDVGVGPGVALALDSTGRADTDNYLTSLLFDDIDISQDWQGMANISYMDINTSSKQKLFPPNTVLPIGSDGNINPIAPAGFVLFPDGFIGNPEVYEQHLRLDMNSVYNGFEDHRVRVGLGFARAELEGKETKNFGPGVIDGTVSPIDGALTDVTGTPFVFIPDVHRTLNYLSLQDEWAFAPDWNLTAGIRYDNYSDFGSTINPRAALVWQTRFNLTSKLLYGRAFRAPSFAELFSINNPIRLGNPDLDPETIDTVEIAFDYQPAFDVHTALNLFTYSIDDLIVLTPQLGGTFGHANADKQKGHGLEWEIDWDINSQFGLSLNYAYQKATNETSNADAGNAPHHQVYTNMKWKYQPDWSLNTLINWVSDRERVAGDGRSHIDDYTVVNIILRKDSHDTPWSYALAIRNVFDEDAREPSPYSAPAAAIPNDFPLVERNYYIEITYSN